MNDKAQQEFEKHCSEWLNMNLHLENAQTEYWKAYNQEETEHKKKNAGQRALNLYLLGELKKVGAHIWRKDKEQKTQVNKTTVKNADKSLVAYRGNGSRPDNMRIVL
jgi:hypothetical protein